MTEVIHRYNVSGIMSDVCVFFVITGRGAVFQEIINRHNSCVCGRGSCVCGRKCFCLVRVGWTALTEGDGAPSQIDVSWPRYFEQNCRKEVLQHHRAGVFGDESVLWSFQLMLLKCCFTSTETAGLLAIGAQDGHLDFHTVPELCSFHMDRIVLYRR